MSPVLWFILSCFFFACMTACGKALSEEFHPSVVVFLRNAGTLCLIVPLSLSHLPEIRRAFLTPMLWVRAGLSQAATTCWFVGVTHVSLPSAMAVSFSTPLFTTMSAMILLKETVRMHRACALGMGFIGVIVILDPFNHLQSLYLYRWVFGAVICWSVVNVVIKKLTNSLSPNVILLYMMGAMSVFSLPMALPHWRSPSAEHLLAIASLSLCTFGWQWCLTKALSKSDLSRLQPFDFSKILFASIIGYVGFGERLSLQGWIGGAIIFASGCYMLWRESVIRKN